MPKSKVFVQSMPAFFDQFFAVLSCLQNERDHESLMAMAKKKVIPGADTGGVKGGS